MARIGETAQQLGISRDTIKRLERRGLINPARDWAGHRRFDEETIQRLRELVYSNAGSKRAGTERAATA